MSVSCRFKYDIEVNQMKIELICKDYQTTVSSLLVYFECTENELIDFLSKDWNSEYTSYYSKLYNKNKYNICDFETYIYRQCRKRFKPIPEKIAVHWFHGTKILDTKLIMQKGIYPLHQMTEYLSHIVDNIAQKIGVKPTNHKTHEMERYKFLIDTKVNNPPDQGPCAFLILDALIHPKIFRVNEYSKIPEYIRDYANYTYDENANEILSWYQKITKAIAVEFIEPSSSKHSCGKEFCIGVALCYIYDILNGAYQTGEMNLACSAAYSNYGHTIHPRSIVQIHDLST